MTTRAPNSIKELASFWQQQGGRNLGIVGDVKHKQKGTSYHLGKSDLIVGAYSTKLRRDRKPTERASALDLGKLDKRIGKLRKFSNWLVEQAEAGLAPDIREIIWSPDGQAVKRWDSHLEQVIVSLRKTGDKQNPIVVVTPGNGDATHFRHTHISFYRDSRLAPKIDYFRPFFEQPIPSKPDDEPEPDPDDDIALDPDDEDDPNPKDDLGPLFVRIQRSPHPRSTLGGIAREFDSTVKQILAFPANKKFRDKPGLVFAGQKVRVR
jgi:hypothetical protein